MPFWKLVLKQFDDLLVKVWPSICSADCNVRCCQVVFLHEVNIVDAKYDWGLQILIAAAVVDFLLALANGDTGIR